MVADPRRVRVPSPRRLCCGYSVLRPVMTEPNTIPPHSEKPTSYRTQSEDTSVWADRLLFERLRTLSSRESLRLCMEACRTMDELLIAGLRRDLPTADDEEIEFRLALTKYGADIVEKFTGRRLPSP